VLLTLYIKETETRTADKQIREHRSKRNTNGGNRPEKREQIGKRNKICRFANRYENTDPKETQTGETDQRNENRLAKETKFAPQKKQKREVVEYRDTGCRAVRGV
jgi:hypothetical protein